MLNLLLTYWKADYARRILWLPVLFGCGIGVYFLLPNEPNKWMTLWAIEFLILVAIVFRHRMRVLYYLAALFIFILGFAVSLMLTFIPILAGKGIIVDNGRRYVYAWQFLHEFIYCMAIGLSEEYVFRGFIYEKVRRLSGTNSMAVIISSILFGFMHLLGGNMIQVTLTALLGALFCYFRLKIKNCSLLSIIICHGVYDFMITVCSSAFMG